MKYDFCEMLELVNRYCNQKYTVKSVPKGLRRVIEDMIKYAENSTASNKKSEGIAAYSYTLDERGMFQFYAGLLSPYKRLRTL